MNVAALGQRILLALVVAASLALTTMTFIGVVHQYSSVPFWDMWDGYLAFFMRVEDGDWSAWWAQNNEHRIMLSRLLFWVVLKFFHGRNALLVAANCALALAAGLTFWALLRAMAPKSERQDRLALGVALLCWLTLWCQQENLVWGFQSQFFLAQWLPLCAIMLIAQTGASDPPSPRFWIACLLGFASAGSMANGVLALPVMLIHQLILRARFDRLLILLLLSLLEIAGYFHGYQAPEGHGSLIQTLARDPWGVLRYVEAYLGGPFFQLSRGSAHVTAFAQAAGTLLLISLLGLTGLELRAGGRDPQRLGLLAFCGYIVLTATITAGGRLIFGVEQAFAGRYTTPALMVWAALFVLLARWYLRPKYRWVVYSTLLIALVAGIWPYQRSALAPRDQALLFHRDMAALALAMDVHDDIEIKNVYPVPDAVRRTALHAIRLGISIFGSPPYREAAMPLGKPAAAAGTLAACPAALDTVQALLDDDRYAAVRGWFWAEVAGKGPNRTLIDISDQDGRAVGFAMLGEERRDVASAVSPLARFAGFHGYVLRSALGAPLVFADRRDGCKSIQSAPRLLYTLKRSKPDQAAVTVRAEDVLEGSGWRGDDYDHSRIPGLAVIGSRMPGDEQTGTLRLRVHNGDTLLIRTGPVADGQFIALQGAGQSRQQLPATLDWTGLTIVGLDDDAPGGAEISLADLGSGWGEWSAVALRASPKTDSVQRAKPKQDR